MKNTQRLIKKLGIEKLNEMQGEAHLAITECPEVVLLSPTGTGKTLAFVLPLLELIDPKQEDVQALILAPSRELALQIEQVLRDLGTGLKVNAVYGGRPMTKDKAEIKHRPHILIGTPGRVADHLRRQTFSARSVKYLVLDEFDKSLEVGFEDEMSEIVGSLKRLQRKVLTSATQHAPIPTFVGLNEPMVVNFTRDEPTKLKVVTVASKAKDKLPTLLSLLKHLDGQPGIVFCNFKASIDRVSEFLHENEIDHGIFYGGMEQIDRERSLIKFRNGTYQVLLATDLAARGLDIPEMKFIIHYHLPMKEHEFIHRNGRTARMKADGSAYVIQWTKEPVPGFIHADETLDVEEVTPKSEDASLEAAVAAVKGVSAEPSTSGWSTLYISGGRKDKVSKGDIVGFLIKVGQLESDQIGSIEVKVDCAFVAVLTDDVKGLINRVNNGRLKKIKVRVNEI
jgi:superfamily II DNA/RNA helicase